MTSTTPGSHHLDDAHDDAPDGGLALDLGRLIGRRRLLALVGTAGAAAFLAACSSDSSATDSTATPTAPTGTATAENGTGTTTDVAEQACDPIPAETSGPYPGDGSNGVNVLTESGVVRSDITTSIGDFTGVATGVPVTLELTLLDSGAGCDPLPNAAVYLWHADSQGRYSLYSNGVTDQNYLRGVQSTDTQGTVRFTTIFPGCYDGRWPHMHFEIYPDVERALATDGLLVTSQLALPQDACDLAYATTGYEASVGNLARTSLATDMVFRDDQAARQTPTITGDATTGFRAALTITV